jgi:hypothetical protein
VGVKAAAAVSFCGPEFPKNLDPSDTVRSLHKRVPFSVIQGEKGTDL